MAEGDIILSDLTTAESLTTATLLYVAIVDALSESGYKSRKATAESIANLINNGIQYAGLNTVAKTIQGAINELQAGGGGGGSSVSWSQIIGSGTKIAEVTINGSTTDVYAPVSGGASYTDVTATLASGNDTVTIQNQAITVNSTVDVYTDVYGVELKDIAVTAGQIVLTFEQQPTAVGVKVRIS